tara:strand:+ start:56 stop:625 length:570 start_codon:yes stop_codon:yes gene_type:complete
MSDYTFNCPPNKITFCKKLPYDLQRYIYNFVSDEIFNSIVFHYNWLFILEILFEHFDPENIINLLSEYFPNNETVCFTNKEIYDVGMYWEKVKPSIYGKRYILHSDDLDYEKASEIFCDKIDLYYNLPNLDNKQLYRLNRKLFDLFKKCIIRENYNNKDFSDYDTEYYTYMRKIFNEIIILEKKINLTY